MSLLPALAEPPWASASLLAAVLQAALTWSSGSALRTAV